MLPEGIYFFILILLLGFAVLDLIVGVSNDAVNFLNSAIGSKVGSIRTILVVATLGIVFGAIFSNGLMEVARKGIFNPSLFSFENIIIIFLAVMLTDVLLLDVFNTIGMPTSTTVSIVFELLGAAVAMAIIKTSYDAANEHSIIDYINTQKAFQIIGGIFLSIFIAFNVGAIAQYFSRIIFSYHYKKRIKYFGAFYAAVAYSALSYFLLVKGMKNISIGIEHIDESIQTNIAIIKNNLWAFFGISFLVWFVIMQFLQSVLKLNTLKLIVFAGTFTLAMAFAGNDLVNFIGVPLAGLESYQMWTASGTASTEFMMSGLSKSVNTPGYLLFIAGIIMALTLWFSKKSRSVTETEVNLGRQEEGKERFSANTFSRLVIYGAIWLGKLWNSLVPKSLSHRIEKNFQKAPLEDGQAFDLVRASVNLTIASILISLATNLKLPLSTTYVSFMVAMGTSLADRAWGRDSAVYRVAGVLNVILGWFITALVAFLVAGLFVAILNLLGWVAVVLLFGLVIYSLIRSNKYHKKVNEPKAGIEIDYKSSSSVTDFANVFEDNLDSIKNSLKHTFKALIFDDRKEIKNATKELEKFEAYKDKLDSSIVRWLKKAPKAQDAQFLIDYHKKVQNIFQSLLYINSESKTHVLNAHLPMEQGLGEKIDTLNHLMGNYCHADSWSDLDLENNTYNGIKQLIDDIAVDYNINLPGSKNAKLYLDLVSETKDLFEEIADTKKVLKPFN